MDQRDMHETARKRAQMVSCISLSAATRSPARTDDIAHELGWELSEVEDYLRVMAGLGWAREQERTWRTTALGERERGE